MIFIICGMFGLICALVVMGKGRSPIGWFVIGFVAPILALILIFVLPDQKEAERKFNRLGKQNRLLRERLRQSRIANKRKLARLDRRLGAHDRVLDMETEGEEAQDALGYEEVEEVDEEDGEFDEERRQRPTRAVGRSSSRSSADGARRPERVARAPARDDARPPARPATRPSTRQEQRQVARPTTQRVLPAAGEPVVRPATRQVARTPEPPVRPATRQVARPATRAVARPPTAAELPALDRAPVVRADSDDYTATDGYQEPPPRPRRPT